MPSVRCWLSNPRYFFSTTKGSSICFDVRLDRGIQDDPFWLTDNARSLRRAHEVTWEAQIYEEHSAPTDEEQANFASYSASYTFEDHRGRERTERDFIYFSLRLPPRDFERLRAVDFTRSRVLLTVESPLHGPGIEFGGGGLELRWNVEKHPLAPIESVSYAVLPLPDPEPVVAPEDAEPPTPAKVEVVAVPPDATEHTVAVIKAINRVWWVGIAIAALLVVQLVLSR